MMKFVSKGIFELLFTLGRVEVKENSGISRSLKDETVVSRLDYGIDFRSEMQFWPCKTAGVQYNSGDSEPKK
jgi:hypothetical protein